MKISNNQNLTIQPRTSATSSKQATGGFDSALEKASGKSPAEQDRNLGAYKMPDLPTTAEVIEGPISAPTSPYSSDQPSQTEIKQPSSFWLMSFEELIKLL